MGQSGAVVWQAGKLNFVIEVSTFLQFEQGNVIPTEQEQNYLNVSFLWVPSQVRKVLVILTFQSVFCKL